MDDEYFISPTLGRVKLSGVIRGIVGFIYQDTTSKYKITVGTDSEGSTDSKNAEFVSVVVVHRVGRHGRYFYKKMNNISVYDRYDRILKEASLSLELAQRVISSMRAELKDALYDFEIHLDIGQNGPTKNMIQEIVGMIVGNGFVAKIKPHSYAANKVADRHVRPRRQNTA